MRQFTTRLISDIQLCDKLARLAQQLDPYLERPQSPLPKRKKQLMNFVNSLARKHIQDPEDVQILQKLI
jgi:hypothetical protein